MNETISKFAELCNTHLEVCHKSLYEITLQQREVALTTDVMYLLFMCLFTWFIFVNRKKITDSFNTIDVDGYAIIGIIYTIALLITFILVIPNCVQWIVNPEYKVMQILDVID